MKPNRTVALALVLAALGAALLACNLPIPTADLLRELMGPPMPTSTETIAVETVQAVLGPEITPAVTDEPCGYYQWASQPLPDVTEELQKYFQDAGQPDLKVTAGAYGENCLRMDGSVVRFLTMYTDIYVTALVAQLEDSQLLGEKTEMILRLVLDYPPEKLPGSPEGYLGITFTDPQGRVENLWLKRLDGKAALDSGLKGEELLARLRRN
jgi:hypothetical protein